MLYGWEGKALHWPCVTDLVLYPPMGSMAWEREMSLCFIQSTMASLSAMFQRFYLTILKGTQC